MTGPGVSVGPTQVLWRKVTFRARPPIWEGYTGLGSLRWAAGHRPVHTVGAGPQKARPTQKAR